MRPRLTGPEMVIAASGALWGLYWIPLRHLEVLGVDALWTTLGLFVAGLLLLVPILLRHPPARTAFTPRMLATGLLTGGAFVLYSISLALTEVVTALLLFYLSPVWATVLGRLLLAERFTGARLTALALGLGGLWVVLGGESGIPLPRNPGDWCALIAGIMWAFGSLRVHQDIAIPSLAHVTSLFIGGTIVSVLVSLLPVTGATAPPASLHAAAIILGLAAITVVSAYGILWGARIVSPGRVGILLLMDVLTGIVSAAAFAGEPFGMAQLVGSMLIVSAGLVEVLPASAPRRA